MKKVNLPMPYQYSKGVVFNAKTGKEITVDDKGRFRVMENGVRKWYNVKDLRSAEEHEKKTIRNMEIIKKMMNELLKGTKVKFTPYKTEDVEFADYLGITYCPFGTPQASIKFRGKKKRVSFLNLYKNL